MTPWCYDGISLGSSCVIRELAGGSSTGFEDTVGGRLQQVDGWSEDVWAPDFVIEKKGKWAF